MSRYIDAAIIDTILDGAIQGEEVTGNPPIINAHDLVCMLNDIPTADVQEVKHGRWEKIYGQPHIILCSVCHSTSVEGRYNYCQNCGAKMDEVEECY